MYMTYTLTVSSQGQIVIPSNLRKTLKLKGGDKIYARLSPQIKSPQIIIESAPKSWAIRVRGIAKGYYGDVDKYIEHERASWDMSKPWP